MDLNHIFLFVAVISPLLVLARAWRPRGILRGWRIAAIIVLAITGVSWLLFREYAGYVGGGAWFALLFLPAVGLRKTSQLAAQGRYDSARRLTTALQFLHPTAQLREQLQLFQRLELHARAGDEIETENAPQDQPGRLRNAPVVVIFILLNIAAFCIELWRGALTNPITLHRLGALDFFAVISKGEFWRLFTALFLHYNLLHLVFNLFALYVLGPPLERTIGAVRFAACYLIAGVGSTGGVVLLTLLKIVRPAELVGASGCIMGIVGAWAGFLLRHRHAWQAKQRLLNILLIIAIQILFDISTPQVSTSAHLCGLVTGFVIGLAVAPKKTAF
ncbi:MAG TPA: rhomboid family intramembrane serine protease [Chthoniobacterales bacterium]|nr:rhomboid family intramembrane serine protease [Chthoniobacterales bacterium]